MHLKGKLRHWAKRSFGSIKLCKLSILHKLEALDTAKESHFLEYLEQTKESNLHLELGSLLHQEELYWRQLSRLTWMKEENLNIKFFHKVANSHYNRNFIFGIQHNNAWVIYHVDIRRFSPHIFMFSLDLRANPTLNSNDLNFSNKNKLLTSPN